jgi:hypothetical protein
MAGGRPPMVPDRLPEPLAVALEVANVLERLGTPYLAAGSLASSLHGEPRSTNDVDLVVDLAPEHVSPLLTMLGNRYYVTLEAVSEAAHHGGTFNLIHLETAVKVDVFVAGDDPFDAERLASRTRVRVGPDERDMLDVDTAEHTILRKLEWYRRGDEVSERQWRDVLGVIRVQGSRLDWDRLATWAARLGVADLLARARGEGGTHTNS